MVHEVATIDSGMVGPDGDTHTQPSMRPMQCLHFSQYIFMPCQIEVHLCGACGDVLSLKPIQDVYVCGAQQLLPKFWSCRVFSAYIACKAQAHALNVSIHFKSFLKRCYCLLGPMAFAHVILPISGRPQVGPC